MNDFDGDVAPMLQVRGEIHCRHSAAPELPLQPIPIREGVGEGSRVVVEQRAERLRCRTTQQRRVSFALGEQVLEVGASTRVVATHLGDEVRAAFRRRVEQCVDQRRERPPVFGR